MDEASRGSAAASGRGWRWGGQRRGWPLHGWPRHEARLASARGKASLKAEARKQPFLGRPRPASSPASPANPTPASSPASHQPRFRLSD
eukprot:2522431-Prymnesium_polylepis.1